MEAGKSSNSTSAVMGVLESFGDKFGGDLGLRVKEVAQSPLWQSFKNKSPNEVLPHAMANLKELKLFDSILSKFGNGVKL